MLFILLRLKALFIKIGFIRISVNESYVGLITGEASHRDVAKYMRPDQVEPFIELHENIKRLFEGDTSVPIPSEVMLCLAQLMTSDPRRFAVALHQVDGLIRRDLEKMVRRHRGENVVSQQQ